MCQFICRIATGLIFTLLALPAFPHDLRPIFIDITEETESIVTLRWKVPGSVERDSLPEIILNGNCTEEGTTEILRYPGDYQSRQTYQCPSGVSGQEVEMIFPVPNPSLTTIIRVSERHGGIHSGMLGPGEYTWPIPEQLNRTAVIKNYTVLGIEHILRGWDHLLFIVCLVLIARSFRRILITITGFTIAHSITLAASSLDLVVLPIAPVEAMIALSIVFVAMEIAKDQKKTNLTYRYPAVVATSFGFLHGFGFASVLRQIGLPQTELPIALLFFNVGVEVGQIIFVAFLLGLGATAVFVREKSNFPVPVPELPQTQRAIAYGIGTLASFWMIERTISFWV